MLGKHGTMCNFSLRGRMFYNATAFPYDESLTLYWDWSRESWKIQWHEIAKLTLSANPFPYKEALPTLTIELKDNGQ